MIETLTSIFSLTFMQQALIITMLVAVASALLSSILVLKGWSLMGDAVSHAVLPGIVIAYILAIPLAIGAFAAGMFCAIAVGYLSENSRVKQDTVMGVVFSGMFGLGVVLHTKIETNVHLDHILFGDMLGVDWQDILETGVIALVCTLVLVLKRRDFQLYAFDPQHARAVGLPVSVLHYVLLAILSLTIVAALKAVGIILTIAFLIAPGAIAFLLTNRFERMMAVSVMVASTSSLVGITASFFLDSAPAPTIVLVMSIIFVGAFLFAPGRGILVSRA
ncbi:MAG: metal ABC transporter permease [Pseudomonadota bacterium]